MPKGSDGIDVFRDDFVFLSFNDEEVERREVREYAGVEDKEGIVVTFFFKPVAPNVLTTE